MKKIAAIFVFSLTVLLLPVSSSAAQEVGLDLNATTSITNEEQTDIQAFVDSSKDAREEFVKEYNEEHPKDKVVNTEPIINPIEKKLLNYYKKWLGKMIELEQM